MKIHPAPQGTMEWLDARLGLPTASQLHRVVTPKTLKLSEQRHAYKCALLSEWLTGVSSDETPTAVMDRGTELEPKAREWYEIVHGVEVQQVGLCLSDTEDYGCSPDGLIGEDGGLEIKCPMMPGYLSHLIRGSESLDDYKMQVQGGLFVCQRDWWDICVYNPKFGGIVTRIEPEVATQEALAHCLPLFIAELNLAKQFLIEKGMRQNP